MRSSSSQWRRSARWRRFGRRSRWVPTGLFSSPTRRRQAPISWRRARCSPRRVEREGADLVLVGQQGGDSDGAVLWAALADRLRLPLVSQAASLEISNGTARSKRQTEYGYDVLEAPLPAVVAVSDAINEPRYPSLKGIMGAKKKPQETRHARRPRARRRRGWGEGLDGRPSRRSASRPRGAAPGGSRTRAAARRSRS